VGRPRAEVPVPGPRRHSRQTAGPTSGPLRSAPAIPAAAEGRIADLAPRRR
jgi:hypothetical protein